jgi:hypothetical protein
MKRTSYHAQVRAALAAGFRKVLGADGEWHDLGWLLESLPDAQVELPDHLVRLKPGRHRMMVLGDRILVVRRRLKEGN